MQEKKEQIILGFRTVRQLDELIDRYDFENYDEVIYYLLSIYFWNKSSGIEPI